SFTPTAKNRSQRRAGKRKSSKRSLPSHSSIQNERTANSTRERRGGFFADGYCAPDRGFACVEPSPHGLQPRWLSLWAVDSVRELPPQEIRRIPFLAHTVLRF